MTRGKTFLWLQTLVCIALVVLLSMSALGLCREGMERKAARPMESIYTLEGIRAKFAPIAPLFFMGLGLLIGGLVLGASDANARKSVQDPALERDFLTARIARPSGAMLQERGHQKKLMWIGRALFALCMLPLLRFLLDPANFPQDDLEGMFFGLLWACLPWTSVGLGVLAVTFTLRDRSIRREILAAREQLKDERAEAGPTAAGPVDLSGKARIVRAVIIVAAVVFIVAGAINGSARDVLYKAITICTECVGLG